VDGGTLAPLYTIEDVQQLLRVSRRTVYNLMGRGDLEPIYLDRRPRFDSLDIGRLIESRRGKPRPGKAS
jgi:hypothetical protein